MGTKTSSTEKFWSTDGIQQMLDNEVCYKDWKFVVNHRDVFINGHWDIDLRLRAEWMGPDAITGKSEPQQSRWWPLSKFMVKTEIIQTAFLCVLKAEEHEIREMFLYKLHDATDGVEWRAPFNSHIDINTLAEAAADVDVRTDSRPSAPVNQRRE